MDWSVLLGHVPGQQQDFRGQENHDQSIHVSAHHLVIIVRPCLTSGSKILKVKYCRMEVRLGRSLGHSIDYSIQLP